MTRYFFDLLDGDSVIFDELGIELPSIEAAQEEAARTLAELVMEQTIGAHRLAIEIRDDDGPLMKALFTFEDRRG
ncbi:DUF6894 family protein [Bradyrhizobium genosp. P]|uniref:DUF6894 family protein n=1 Tax=Bradyrhizobium genosp. P TaxID=83641 RepID=UPI003CEE8BF0